MYTIDNIDGTISEYEQTVTSNGNCQLRKVEAIKKKSDIDWNVTYPPFDYSVTEEYLNKVNQTFGIEWIEERKGVYKIFYDRNFYTYWPKSGKWRARGSNPIYRSKSIESFFMDYVLKYFDWDTLPARKDWDSNRRR